MIEPLEFACDSNLLSATRDAQAMSQSPLVPATRPASSPTKTARSASRRRRSCWVSRARARRGSRARGLDRARDPGRYQSSGSRLFGMQCMQLYFPEGLHLDFNKEKIKAPIL